eukprot:351270-Chlamydomonas_euryale.AAC.6
MWTAHLVFSTSATTGRPPRYVWGPSPRFKHSSATARWVNLKQPQKRPTTGEATSAFVAAALALAVVARLPARGVQLRRACRPASTCLSHVTQPPPSSHAISPQAPWRVRHAAVTRRARSAS